MEQSTLFSRWMQTLSTLGGEFTYRYMEYCNKIPAFLETNQWDIQRFRVELASHIRDSSAGPYARETQWGTDERLRDLWFDLFGIEPAPGDPYPVPRERWARHRTTTYLRGVQWRDPEFVLDEEWAWLAARGLTLADLAAYHEPDADVEYSRPEPAGFRQRLSELTAQGRRLGPAEGRSAEQARVDLLDAKQSYLADGRHDLADGIDTILADREPRRE